MTDLMVPENNIPNQTKYFPKPDQIVAFLKDIRKNKEGQTFSIHYDGETTTTYWQGNDAPITNDLLFNQEDLEAVASQYKDAYQSLLVIASEGIKIIRCTFVMNNGHVGTLFKYQTPDKRYYTIEHIGDSIPPILLSKDFVSDLRKLPRRHGL